MKRKVFTVLCISICCALLSSAQTPGVKWTQYFEFETSQDYLLDLKPTKDKGFILAGSDTTFHSLALYLGIGDFLPQGHACVKKLDSTGSLMWKKLPITNCAGITSIEQTQDGGFITAGYTTFYPSHDSLSCIISKLSSNGSVEWQKYLGGTNKDIANAIIQTNDNGYLAVGKTSSNDGDVSGNHGMTDIWVIKVDVNGNVVWTKCFGGSSFETGASVIATSDMGFIIAGSSLSNDGDITNNKGNYDGLVIKIDANGNLIWQKNFGGTGEDHLKNIQATADGGYFLTGFTSSNDGDISGNHGATDVWITKIDATGNLQWSKCMGGTNNDYGLSSTRTLSGDFLVTGSTSSSDGDVTNNNGGSDMWMLLLSPEGNIIWQKTIGTNKDEYGMAGFSPSDHVYVCAGYGAPLNSVYVGPSQSMLTYLGNANTIKGNVYLDANSNGIKDPDEGPFDQLTIKITKGQTSYSAIPYNGSFHIDTDTGTFITSTVLNNSYYTVLPTNTSSTFASYFQTDSVGFAVQTIPGIKDMSVSLLPITVARPGFNLQYKIEVKNLGPVTLNNQIIKLAKDPRLIYMSSSPTHVSIINDTILWNISSIAPLSNVSITVNFVVAPPPTVIFGDTLKSVAITPLDGDITPSNDTSRLKQLAVGSYDPNDKTETNGGIITPDQISSGEYLNYLIRFQNTGTDTAFNVIIRDTLSNMLDWNSLQIISSSHAYNLQINDGNKLSWYFNDIKLVDSNMNEPASHGYIAFKIRPLNTLQVGDTVKNTAAIYFDYNLPVQTNTEKTAVLLFPFGVLPIKLAEFKTTLKDNSYVQIDWQTTYEQNAEYFEVQRSKDGIRFEKINKVKAAGLLTGSNYSVKDFSPFDGVNYYRLKSVDKDGSATYSQIELINKNNEAVVYASLYPNPSNGQVTLKLQGKLKGQTQVTVTDLTGKRVFYKEMGSLDTDRLTINLDVRQLLPGTYLVQFIIDEKIFNQQLIIQ